MNNMELLEAKVAALSARLTQVETRLAALQGRGGSGPGDEEVAARLVREFGGDWEAVKNGKHDNRSNLARALTVEVLVCQGRWSQRRAAETLGMSRQGVQKTLRRLSAGLANHSQN